MLIRCHNKNWILANPDIGNSEIFPEEYVVFCKDRVWKTGGGVLIVVNKTYVSKRQKTTTVNWYLLESTSKIKKIS